ncbi:MAG: HEAT repeat domain-containing protein [Candidatus Latescibacterota bacterium]|nr:HEAT repeat domain-containing protein [Candidatus Latescibacterota bacterium]
MLKKIFIVLIIPLMSCTNINQMHRKYLEGDKKQFDRIVEIVSRSDYPYATRRKAAQILGEIGDSRATPVLITALQGYEQRTTLKQDIVRSLAKIGDPDAAQPIGRLLDRSLNTADADLRMAAVDALGDLGGEKSAEILVNALRYFDLLILRDEQRSRKGVFTGEEQIFPFGPAGMDSTGNRPPRFSNPAMGGLLGQEQHPQMSMFGTPINPEEMQYDPTPEEREHTHQSLVRVGEEAVTVIEGFIAENEMTLSLRQELLGIVSEIRGVTKIGLDED